MSYVDDSFVFLLLFVLSFAICGVIVLSQSLHIDRSTRAEDLKAIQAAHTAPTPRIGGLSVVTPIVVAMLLIAPPRLATEMQLFALTLLPVFAAGMAEDLGFRVSPLTRLVAAATASGLVIVLLGAWAPPLMVPGLDSLFGFTPFAIVFTIAWASGICHAMNLIDGVNGFAGATAVLIALGLGFIGLQAGTPILAGVAFAIVPAVLGFLVFNWPLGRIFLGDAGAYTLGHVLVWLSILIMAWGAQAAPTAVALVFFWPVADTFLAIYRRTRSGRPLGQPDRLHTHQFVMRALMMLPERRLDKAQANALSALILTPFAAMPVIAAVLLWDRPVLSLLAWAVFGFLFVAAYMTGIWSLQNGKRRRSAGCSRGDDVTK